MSLPVVSLDRRRFLAQVTLSVGGVALSGVTLAGIAPVSLLESVPAACLVNAAEYPDACGDWTVDDMCAAYPPYAFNTGACPPHTLHYVDEVAGADHHWMS